MAVPILVFAVPPQAVEAGPSLCLWKNLFGFECPNCGMTRACWRAARFDFQAAWAFNRMVCVVFPLLIMLWTVWTRKALRNARWQLNYPCGHESRISGK